MRKILPPPLVQRTLTRASRMRQMQANAVGYHTSVISISSTINPICRSVSDLIFTGEAINVTTGNKKFYYKQYLFRNISPLFFNDATHCFSCNGNQLTITTTTTSFGKFKTIIFSIDENDNINGTFFFLNNININIKGKALFIDGDKLSSLSCSSNNL